MSGYGLRAYGKAFLDLIGLGRKPLEEKAVNVRRTLSDVRKTIIDEQPLTVLVPRIIARCKEDHGEYWALAACAQLGEIKGISIDSARPIVSEFCTDSLV